MRSDPGVPCGVACWLRVAPRALSPDRAHVRFDFIRAAVHHDWSSCVRPEACAGQGPLLPSRSQHRGRGRRFVPFGGRSVNVVTDARKARVEIAVVEHSGRGTWDMDRPCSRLVGRVDLPVGSRPRFVATHLRRRRPRSLRRVSSTFVFGIPREHTGARGGHGWCSRGRSSLTTQDLRWRDSPLSHHQTGSHGPALATRIAIACLAGSWEHDCFRG